MKLAEFEGLTNFGITDPRMTTIGGVMLRGLDRPPRVGDEVVIDGVVLTVLEMQDLRIARLRASKGADLPAQESTPEPSEDTETPGDDS